MIRITRILLYLFTFISFSENLQAQQTNKFQVQNPIVPGYFADPTIKKFRDTYYLYTTTDGIKLASGKPQVWISKDLKNWYNQKMQIQLPQGLLNNWAPDVVKSTDHRYYYFSGNCEQGCNIYGYVSTSPTGPWSPLKDGYPIISPNTTSKKLPALDAQFLRNDDGTVYAWFGTWCTSFGGMGWVQFRNDDFNEVYKKGFIPIKEIPHAFEAAYPLKIKNIYFLFYSSGDCRLDSYAVHYAWSHSPKGPWHYGKNNPILSTDNEDHTDSPGHNSILNLNGNYYLFYHRHNIPHSTGGEFRQICANRLVFTDSVTIQRINPNDKKSLLSTKSSEPKDIAYHKPVTASSSYHLVAPANKYNKQRIDYEYSPLFITDHSNGTLWKASTNSLPQDFVIDLGKNYPIRKILTEFEYPTYYYQYKIETSTDQVNWKLYVDRTKNKYCGCPMIDENSQNGRYVKITVTGTEKNGLFAAIWNVKIYRSNFETPCIQEIESLNSPGYAKSKGLLINLQSPDSIKKPIFNKLDNRGKLKGSFYSDSTIRISYPQGIASYHFSGKNFLQLSIHAPQSLDWNASYSAMAWIYTPKLQQGACIISWNSRANMLQESYSALMYGNGPYGAVAHGDASVDLSFNTIPPAGKWHFIAITFDGMLETIYVDGKVDQQIPMNLFVTSGEIRIGSSGEPNENFKGNIACLRLYDKALSQKSIIKIMDQMNPGIKQINKNH